VRERTNKRSNATDSEVSAKIRDHAGIADSHRYPSRRAKFADPTLAMVEFQFNPRLYDVWNLVKIAQEIAAQPVMR